MSQDNNQTPVKAPKTVMQKQDDVKQRLLELISESQNKGEVPRNYSPNNALNSAWLYLMELRDKDGKSALETCSTVSVMTSLMKMLQYGLSVTKQQCYLIPYAGKLSCDISYHGKELIAKRDGGVVSVTASAIYEGDEFAFEVDSETGGKKITNHKQTLESIGNGTKIKGAYAVVSFEEGRKETTIMTKDQILMAWNQRQGQGLTPAHQKFTDEMACKTVRNRALKNAIGSSDDSSMMEEGNDTPKVSEAAQAVKQKANAERFDFDEHEEISSKQTAEPKAEPKAEAVQAESPSFA